MRRSERNGIASQHDEFDWGALARSWDKPIDSKVKEVDMSDTGTAGKISSVVAWVVVWAILIALITLAAKGIYVWVPFIWNLF